MKFDFWPNKHMDINFFFKKENVHSMGPMWGD